MNLSRRSFGAMLGMAGIGSVARNIGTTVYPATGGPTGSFAPELGLGVNDLGGIPERPPAPRGPFLTRSVAYRLAMLDPTARDCFEEQIAQSCRRVEWIDPDIDVHKSVSRAAKIVYQRQRNMEQERLRLRTDLDDEWREQLPLHRFMKVMQLFQWGKKK